MEEKKVERGLTGRALIIGIIYVLFVSVSMTYMECFHTFGLPWAGSVIGRFVDPSWNVMPWAWTILYTFILLGIMSLLPSKYRLNRQEITVVMVMVMLSVPMVLPQNHIIYIPWYAVTYYSLIPALWGEPYVSAFKWLTPWTCNFISKDAWMWPNGYYGRPDGIVPAPFNWSNYFPATLWWLGQWISLMFLMIFVAAILRRLWIEKESLPFPNVARGMELVDKFTKGSGEKAVGKLARISQEKWLLLGVLIAQVMLLPGWLWKIYESMKLDVTPFAVTLTKHTGVGGPWMNLIIPMIPIALCWTSPFGLGLSLTMPFDVLVSFIIVWLVAIVITVNAEIAMGLFPALPAGADMAAYTGRALMYLIPMTPTGVGWAGVAMGVIVASAIYPLVTSTGREYVKEVFRLIRSPSAEAEKGEALPYRWLVCGAVAFFLAYLAFYVVTPASSAIWYIAIVQFINVIIWVGGARYVAETGAWGGYWLDGTYIINQFSGYNIGLVRWGLGAIIGRSSTDPAKNAPQAYSIIACSGSAFQERTIVAQTTPWMMEGFTLASLTGTRIRDLLIAAIVAIIVTWIGGGAMWLWYSYAHNWFGVYYQYTEADFGAPGALQQARGLLGPYDWWAYGWWGEPAIPQILGTWAIGIVITFVAYMLRARYPKFIFHPMAIVLWFGYRHGSFSALPGAMFLSVIIALVVKYVTTRYYGVEFYDKKIKPLALGLMLGTMLWAVITFMLDQAFVVKWYR